MARFKGAIIPSAFMIWQEKDEVRIGYFIVNFGINPLDLGLGERLRGVAQRACDAGHAARELPIRTSSRKETGTRGRSHAVVWRCGIGDDR